MIKTISHTQLKKILTENNFNFLKEEIEKRFINSKYVPIILNYEKMFLVDKKFPKNFYECAIKIEENSQGKIAKIIPTKKVYNLKTNVKDIVGSYLNLNESEENYKIFKNYLANELVNKKINISLIKNVLTESYAKSNAEKSIVDFELLSSVVNEDKKINKKIKNFNKKYEKKIKKVFESQKNVNFYNIPAIIDIEKPINVILEKKTTYVPRIFVNMNLIEEKDFVITDKEIYKVKNIVDNKFIEVLTEKKEKKIVSKKEIKNILKGNKVKNFKVAKTIAEATKYLSLEKIGNYYYALKNLDNKKLNENFIKEFIVALKTNNYKTLFENNKELAMLPYNLFLDFIQKTVITNKLNKYFDLQETVENLRKIYNSYVVERKSFHFAMKRLIEDENVELDKILFGNNDNNNSNNNEEKSDAEKLLDFNKPKEEENKEEDEKEKDKDRTEVIKNFAKELRAIYEDIIQYLPEDTETYKYIENIINFLQKLENGELPKDIEPEIIFNILVILTGQTDFHQSVDKIIKNLEGEEEGEEGETESNTETEENNNEKTKNESKVFITEDGETTTNSGTAMNSQTGNILTTATVVNQQNVKKNTNQSTQSNQNAQNNQQQNTNQQQQIKKLTDDMKKRLASAYGIQNGEKMGDKQLLLAVLAKLPANSKQKFCNTVGVGNILDNNGNQKISNDKIADMVLAKLPPINQTTTQNNQQQNTNQ